ncbi:hypothetical protein [Mesomycoplasma molare]|uniref:Uncharacterized protein n=1 Tax=Mesomycoplasma molare TaxID=171288 RepID=A0ABY5TZX2_9BACT|nr:hypothetical protein [Mesomycoplasma molare]UWD34584.1 hypothetical protein NX772_02015 [Mesomycoplasma molare]
MKFLDIVVLRIKLYKFLSLVYSELRFLATETSQDIFDNYPIFLH